MDDTEFERLLERKYAQVVLETLLDAEGYSCAFSALQEEVNMIIADDSRGAKEKIYRGEYSPASLNSLLSAAEDAGIVAQYLNEDGNVRWRLRHSQLSQSQMGAIRSRNGADTVHADTASVDAYSLPDIDPKFS